MNAAQTPSLFHRCLAEFTGKRELTATETQAATRDLARVLMDNPEFRNAALEAYEYGEALRRVGTDPSKGLTVQELRAVLRSCPPNAPVGYVWDGAIRSEVQRVWVAENGKVALAEVGDYVTFDDVPVGYNAEHYDVE